MNPTVNNNSVRVQIKQTTSRQTPKTDFGTMMKQGLNTAADVSLQAGSIPAPFLPGGAVVSAAISGVQQMKNVAGGSLGSASGALGTSGSVGTPIASGVSSGGVSSSATSGGTVADTALSSSSTVTSGVDDFKSNLELSSQMQLQFLEIQQQMQSENRQYTLMSNIMKTKHDTAKAAINNVR